MSTFSNDYDELLALTDAAETCNANARSFIRQFGERPEFSKDGWAASMQAKQHMDRANLYIDRLAGYSHKWDEAAGALSYIRMAVGINLPQITIDDGTYQTAHEAAYYLAEAVDERFRSAEGFTDIEVSNDLAERLADLTLIQDLYGRIQAESSAAKAITPIPDGDDAADDGAIDSNEQSERKTRWWLVHSYLDQDANGGDKWDDAKRRQFVIRYNTDCKSTAGFTQLSLKKLGEIIRERRKLLKNDE